MVIKNSQRSNSVYFVRNYIGFPQRQDYARDTRFSDAFEHAWRYYNARRCAWYGIKIGRLRWVYTFDAVKRFDTLSYASQMRIKAFCGVSVYTFHAGISARQRARESVARRKMLQSSTVLNFHALRQRTQAIQPIIYRCHELSLQRIDLAITSKSSHWTINSWRRSRKAHLIAVKVQSWPCWSNWGFRSCLTSPDIQFILFL